MADEELTIKQVNELDWEDGIYSSSDEEALCRSYEDGWSDLVDALKQRGHTSIMFDPQVLDI